MTPQESENERPEQKLCFAGSNWYYKVLGGHTHVRVFMNGGKCGDLCFRNEEFQQIAAAPSIPAATVEREEPLLIEGLRQQVEVRGEMRDEAIEKMTVALNEVEALRARIQSLEQASVTKDEIQAISNLAQTVKRSKQNVGRGMLDMADVVIRIIDRYRAAQPVAAQREGA